MGFLPISAAYAYGGAVIGAVAKGGINQGLWAWTLYALELAFTIAVTVWITRAAQKALRAVAPEVVEEENTTTP
jgi:hypothetical protein